MSSEYKPNIVVISPPVPPHNRAREVILKKLLTILSEITHQSILITSNFPENSNLTRKNNIQIRNIKLCPSSNYLFKFINFALFQIKASLSLVKLTKKENNIDLVIIFTGNELILPIITSKFLNKQTLLILTGSIYASKKTNFHDTSHKRIPLMRLLMSYIFYIIEGLNIILSDYVGIEGYSLKQLFNVESLIKKGITNTNKVYTHLHLYVDASIFYEIIPVKKRKNILGYIGRLSEEKGIYNLLKAFTLLFSDINPSNVEIHIVGSGPLIDTVITWAKSKRNINVYGWVDYMSLNKYLNNLKALILPSFSEGLPNIILEAMATGTPVIATNVGAIPDVISHNKTGILLKNNTPTSIVNAFLIVLFNPKRMIKFSHYSKLKIHKTYNYISAIERYQEVISKILTKVGGQSNEIRKT